MLRRMEMVCLMGTIEITGSLLVYAPHKKHAPEVAATYLNAGNAELNTITLTDWGRVNYQFQVEKVMPFSWGSAQFTEFMNRYSVTGMINIRISKQVSDEEVRKELLSKSLTIKRSALQRVPVLVIPTTTQPVFVQVERFRLHWEVPVVLSEKGDGLAV